MKNKINIIIVSIPLILIILMLFNYDYHSNEIELDDFLDRNEIIMALLIISYLKERD